MIVTELPEIVTAAAVSRVMSSKTTVTLLFWISTPCTVEDPVTMTVAIKSSLTVLHVRVSSDTDTDPTEMLHIMMEMR
jgi:hypothetical protein